jgi:hypothetical protein
MTFLRFCSGVIWEFSHGLTRICTDTERRKSVFHPCKSVAPRRVRISLAWIAATRWLSYEKLALKESRNWASVIRSDMGIQPRINTDMHGYRMEKVRVPSVYIRGSTSVRI